MSNKTLSHAMSGSVVLALVCLIFVVSHVATVHAQPPATEPKAKTMTNRITGTFEVKLAAQNPHFAETNLGRMSIDKKFNGPLDATSKGEMLSAMGDVKGSAGYVAIERVTGTLEGKRGSFVLQHSGTMNRGAPSLAVTVVPDSGTDELKGLSGKMNIVVKDGKHSYEFEYLLAPTP